MVKNPLKLVCAFAVLASTQASAQLFNFSASGGSPTGLVVLDSSTDGDANYNPLIGGSSAVTSVGAPSAVSNSLSGYDQFGPNPYFTDTSGTAITAGDANLMGSYYFRFVTNDGGGQLVDTLSGLTTGDVFTLVVYASGDSATQGSVISLTNGQQSQGPLTTSGEDRLIENGQGDAYQVFSGILTAPTLTITLANITPVSDAAEQFTAFNGLQFEEVPEPCTYAMMGLGCLLLAFTLRTRRTAPSGIV